MSSSRTLTETGTGSSADPTTTATPASEVNVSTVDEADAPQASGMPHDCVSNTDRSIDRGARSRRELGIDVARGLALLGMMVVHILPAATRTGEITTPWLLSVGKASALFAVVAGVGIAFSTGRTRPPYGRRWYAAVAALLVRAALICALGLWLGGVVGQAAYVILPYYALLFVLAIPFLRMPVRWLVVAAVAAGFAMPTVSFFARAGMPWEGEPLNLTFASVIAGPAASLNELLFTGSYPVLPWLTYVLVGLAVGRTRLSMRGVAAAIAGIGIALALFTRLVSWYLLSVIGGQAELAETSRGTISLQSFTDILVFGSSGTVPADSAWWLAVLAPHTATTPDLFFTIGIALGVLGLAIMLSRVIGPLLWPLAAAGSMPLTLYATHLLLLALPVMPRDAGVNFAVQAAVLVAFALLWRNWFARGPLEELVWRATDLVRRRVLKQRTPSKELGDSAQPLQA